MATTRIDHADATIWWTDDTGVVHICESAEPIGAELLIWTLCDREVEASATFAPSAYDEVSCSKCNAAQDVLKRRAQSAHQETILP